ncbi:Membrane protein involved in the export of O-antigen and teichoic acid [Desulfatibacillum alkenivorans DSM 16219]|jgi:O-antigen/teichoic acid export membrane protein|uniref:Membrane protein involved in the export of O-antigen and teichoic acid n=1 Tax=Desulfatibacillum alkenivorans DSM 16219 TaxID=1121393 RepID=A0A1M6UG82_9BACT|nr:oligosaccharide flippase family protein [Desulfatibacillum alkenivorans]SHK68153.1 Membrane protein involved in the export of O-antigen and teichoic acid [Desulfatibacillum alkenivorans DSM 16219]
MNFTTQFKINIYKFFPFLDKSSGNLYKNFGSYSIARQLLNLRGLFFLPIIIKSMDLKSYGYYSLGLVISAFLVWFMMLGLSTGLLRFLSGVNDEKRITQDFNMVFLAVMCTSAFLLIFCFVFGKPISFIFFQTKEKVMLSIIVILFSSFEALRNVALIYYRLFDRVNFYIMAEISLNIMSIVFMIIAIYTFGTVESLFAAQAFSSFIILIVLFIKYMKIFQFTISPFYRIKDYLKFSIPIMLPTLMLTIITRFDRYIICKYFGIEVVGIYNACYSLPRLIQSALASISFIYNPMFNRLWNQGKKNELINKMKDSVNLFSFIGFPMWVGMIVIGKPIIELLSNEKVAQSSLLVIPYVGMAYMSYIIYGFGFDILSYQRKSLQGSYFAMVGAIISLSLNIIVIPKMGLLGASLSMLAAYISMSAIALYNSRKYLILEFDWNHIFLIVLSSLLMGVIVHLMHYYISNLIFLILSGVISYIILCSFFTGIFTKFGEAK